MFSTIIKTKDRINKLVKQVLVNESVFLKRVGVLLSGSFFSMALPVLVAPVLSRLYLPEDIGTFGLFSAAVSICAIISTLRYDTAILIPQTHSEAVSLVSLCFLSIALCSVLFWTLGFIGGEEFLSMTGLTPLGRLWVYIPLGGLLLATFQTLSTWHVRTVRFKGLAASRVSVSAGMAATQVLGGSLKWGEFGLIFGQIIGQASGAFILFCMFWRHNRGELLSVTVRMMKETARKFRGFPLFSMPGSLANVLSNSMPLFLIGIYFGPAVVGFFALTQRVLAAPTALAGTAVLDVFKERAATDYRKYGSCRDVYRKTCVGLLMLSIPPSLILFFAAPPLFAIVFGEGWREAGEYASLMAPLLLVRFVASPLSYVFFIAQKQYIDLVWQLCLLLVSTLSIIIGAKMDGARYCVMLFSAGFTIMYLVYIGLSYYYGKAHTVEEVSLT